jgi:hypothetical protein
MEKMRQREPLHLYWYYHCKSLCMCLEMVEMVELVTPAFCSKHSYKLFCRWHDQTFFFPPLWVVM